MEGRWEVGAGMEHSAGLLNGLTGLQQPEMSYKAHSEVASEPLRGENEIRRER
jgi:hypothetical protein